MTSREEAIAAWGAASSLADLGELTAQWLGGRLPYIPSSWAEGPDPETKALIGTLAAFNRAGFVTYDSQPGEPPQGGWAQRACVHGFCAEETGETLAFACLANELMCLVSWPGAREGPFVSVTIDDGRAFTWQGVPIDPEQISHEWGEACSPQAVTALVSAWQVAVIDPVWGRNDLLWTTLETALAGRPTAGALPPLEGED